jgi:hypothetical protein
LAQLGIARLDLSNALADSTWDELDQRSTVLPGGKRGLTICALHVRQRLDAAIVTDKRRSGKGLVMCG